MTEPKDRAPYVQRTIWKYPLREPVVRLSMPADACVIDVQTQDGVPTLWALCTPSAAVREREFVGIGTGHPIPEDGLVYLGSAHNVERMGLVFHIFERPLA